MRSLPDVTLVAIDTAYHDLTRMAIEDSCKELKFAKTIVFTDKPSKFSGIVDEAVEAEANNNTEAEQILWYKVPEYIHTSHILTVQWDGWVINPHLWNDDWLEYDYIGAPWPYEDGLDVGNGGFSLRSKKLIDVITTDFKYVAPEDNTICREYRRELELRGFKWPDKTTAECFSFEYHPRRSFGFHRFHNWPLVLTKEDIGKRSCCPISYLPTEIANGNSYAKLMIETGVGFGFLKDNA